MPKSEALSTRVTRLENNMIELQDMLKVLVTAQLKTEDQFQEMANRIKEMDQHLGKRIEALVSDIGRFMLDEGEKNT